MSLSGWFQIFPDSRTRRLSFLKNSGRLQGDRGSEGSLSSERRNLELLSGRTSRITLPFTFVIVVSIYQPSLRAYSHPGNDRSFF